MPRRSASTAARATQARGSAAQTRGSATPRSRASSARQRQRLIDACITALHVHGPSETTVEKVVAVAGMSPGIIRFYFRSKAAMLVAALAQLAAEFEQRVLVPVAALRATPARALEELVQLYLDADIASPRKVSVWYSFWGEASSRQEYLDLCGQKDAQFAALVRELVGALVRARHLRQVDSDAIALGLIGVLEVLWQDIAFQKEASLDRPLARRRALAYLASIFPKDFSVRGTRRTATRHGRSATLASTAGPVLSAEPLPATAALPATELRRDEQGRLWLRLPEAALR